MRGNRDHKRRAAQREIVSLLSTGVACRERGIPGIEDLEVSQVC
jgi:hypothetical protein